ncbi:MAG: pyridoxamine 5'-phosphate oxidase [Bacteroidales bacterium]|nr:pyridoxamine 5'-phosphate oxidase [Bacteroidales bacterium]
MLRDLSNKKTNYTLAELSKKEVDKNPFNQFVKWLDTALEKEINEANAMILSTVGADNRPSSRVVLLKGVADEGFMFYTNYHSKKGKQLSKNPNASLIFFWADLERQVRIEGIVEKLSADLSDEYFNKRPFDSQLGATISPQSQEIPNRDYLLNKKNELELKTGIQKLKRPDYWGGYILKPNLFEFWQGRANRLSDRIQYTLKKDDWEIVRLAP